MTTENQMIKQQLIQYAREIGIDKIGFTNAEPFEGLMDILLAHRELGYESGFEEKDINKRVDPLLSLSDAKTIIAIAIAYPSKVENLPKNEEENYHGFIARSAWGIDYHVILQEKLNQIGEFLQKLKPEAQFVTMTDTGVLSDHAVAERSGIGWIGKNSLLITPEFGSYVYLGELVTNIPLPIDKPMENLCGDCTICMKKCPTEAIVNPGQINAKTCLSFITQRKDMLEEQWMEKIGNRLYGCDTCQMVCPYNKGINSTHREEIQPNPELVKPLLKPLLKISNKEFQRTWGSTAAAWRGKKPLQRNAIIALAHFKDQSAIPLLKEILLKDERPMIRQTTAWALGKLGVGATNVLFEALEKEKEEEIQAEIKNALDKLKKTI